jgi:hypothetical protein
MNAKHFIILQILLLLLIISFGILLLFGCVRIPSGVEGEWFTKIWEIILLVGNLAGLAVAVKYSDDLLIKGDSLEKDSSDSVPKL